jgi:hypothetical protein
MGDMFLGMDISAAGSSSCQIVGFIFSNVEPSDSFTVLVWILGLCITKHIAVSLTRRSLHFTVNEATTLGK